MSYDIMTNARYAEVVRDVSDGDGLLTVVPLVAGTSQVVLLRAQAEMWADEYRAAPELGPEAWYTAMESRVTVELHNGNDSMLTSFHLNIFNNRVDWTSGLVTGVGHPLLWQPVGYQGFRARLRVLYTYK